MGSISKFSLNQSIRMITTEVKDDSSLNGYPYRLTWSSHTVGWLPSPDANPSKFRENIEFTNDLHEVLKQYCHSDPEMIEQADREGEGWGHIIDKRKKLFIEGRIPEADDIFGSVKFEQGKPVEGSYQPSGTHRLYTLTGSFSLPEYYHKPLQEYLMNKNK